MKKHSVELSGHRTSIALEEEFWQELKKIAKNKNTSVRQLLIQIDDAHQGNLSSAIRLFILREGQVNQKTDSQ